MGDQRDGGIAWTDETWNPVRGCSRVSEGCRFCYAERVAARFSGPSQPYEGLAEMTPSGPRWTGKVELVEEHLADPIRWKRPRRIFVNSMSDLFHEGLSDYDIERVFGVMALATHHTFQVLTKRADRMARWFNEPLPIETRADQVFRAAEHLGQKLWGEPGAPFAFDGRGSDPANYLPRRRHPKALANRRKWPGWPLPNVWLGVSVENLEAAEARIPHLLRVPAAVRFLSCEPLLESLDLTRLYFDDSLDTVDVLRGERTCGQTGCLTDDDMATIDWVIVGGESGSAARPMHPDWARRIRDECAAAGVPYFHKQNGEWLHRPDLGGVFEGQAGALETLEAARGPEGSGGRNRVRVVNHAGGHGFHGEGALYMERVGKKVSGSLLDGLDHKAFPEERA